MNCIVVEIQLESQSTTSTLRLKHWSLSQAKNNVMSPQETASCGENILYQTLLQMSSGEWYNVLPQWQVLGYDDMMHYCNGKLWNVMIWCSL